MIGPAVDVELTSIEPLWRRLKRSRVGMVGAVTLTVMALLAFFGPAVLNDDPASFVDARLRPPSRSYLMGTDDLGRDVFIRFVHGAKSSLLVGLIAALMGMVIGILVGAIAGFFGSYLDATLMRITEIFQLMPRFILALAVIALLGPGFLKVIFVIGILSWPPLARVVRAEFLTLREQAFVEAATSVGMRPLRIIFSEILPNAMPAVIVLASFEVAHAILLETGLSFLGLGDANVISWGTMLNEAQRYLNNGWWMAVFPGLGIFSLVLAFNLLGDGINDAQNPRLQQDTK